MKQIPGLTIQSRSKYPELRLVLRQDRLVQCFQDDEPRHNSIPHGSWERDGLGLTVTFHYGGFDCRAKPHVFSRVKHTDVRQQMEEHGGARLIPWPAEPTDASPHSVFTHICEVVCTASQPGAYK